MWTDAEGAFYSFAKKHSRNEKAPEALYKAGLCRLKTRDNKGALTLFKKVATNKEVVKSSPEIASGAYYQLYLYYLKAEMRPAREKVISDCQQYLRNQLHTATICEMEGDNRLITGDIDKALGYYRLAGKDISITGTHTIELLSRRTLFYQKTLILLIHNNL